jgi:tRNA pseudouridine38-40 synthase
MMSTTVLIAQKMMVRGFVRTLPPTMGTTPFVFLLFMVAVQPWSSPSLLVPRQQQQNEQELLRYRARVAYDGSAFSGFQLQQGVESKRTVQGCLEEALLSSRCFCGNSVLRVVAASRTDAGVHARGQAIHFDVLAAALLGHNNAATTIPDEDDPLLLVQQQRQRLQKVEYSLNKILPADIRIWNLQPAPPPNFEQIIETTTSGGSVLLTKKLLPWNVLYESTQKLYSYRISLAPVMDPLERYHRWHLDSLKGKPVDLSILSRLLPAFEGTHDFRAFAGGVEQLEKTTGGLVVVNTVRTIYSVDLVDEGGGNFRIDFRLKGALYKQVRNMVGTVLDASRGLMTEEAFLRLIGGVEAGDGNERRTAMSLRRRNNPSKPAPPQGLTLEYVYFDKDEHGF